MAEVLDGFFRSPRSIERANGSTLNGLFEHPARSSAVPPAMRAIEFPARHNNFS
jgi:hypothetical protein